MAFPRGRGGVPGGADPEKEAKERFAEAEAWRRYYFSGLNFDFEPVPGTVPKEDETPTMFVGGDKYLGKGLYKVQWQASATEEEKKKAAHFHIAVDENGTAYPVPKWSDKNDAKFREAYSKTMDYIARTYSKVEIEWPWPPQYSVGDAGLTQEKLMTLCQLAEEKGLAIEFGPSVKSFLESLSVEDRERFLMIQAELGEKRQQTLLLAGLEETPLTSATNKLTGKNRDGTAEEIKTRLLENQATREAHPPETKLKNIEDEMKDATDRLAQLNKSSQELHDYLNTSQKLLNEPAKLQKDRVAGGLSFTERMGNYWKRKWVDKHKNEREQLAQDPTRVVTKVGESLNRTKTQRDALLAEMRAEKEYLENKVKGCQQAMAQMRAEATETPGTGGAPPVPAWAPLDPAQQARLKALEDKSKTLFEPAGPAVGGAASTPEKGELVTVKAAVDAVVAQNATFTPAHVARFKDIEEARQHREGKINPN